MSLTSILGSLAPSVGTALGSIGGPWLGFAGNVGGTLLGNYLNSGQQSNPQQQMQQSPSFYNQLQDAQSNYLSQLQQRQPQFQQVDINPYLQGARQEFQQQIVPGIAERFSGANAQRSSAFGNALGAASSGLAQKLAELQTSHAQDQQSKMMQHRGQNMQQMGMLGNFINQQSQLGQNQNQFNQQQQNTSPYWLNPLVSGLGSLGNLWSGEQNRMVQSQQGQQQAVNNAQTTGLGQQYQTVNNQALPGALNSLIDIFSGVGKIAGSRY